MEQDRLRTVELENCFTARLKQSAARDEISFSGLPRFDEGDTNGWCGSVAKLLRAPVRVECWVERYWLRGETVGNSHMWAGLASNSKVPFKGIFASEQLNPDRQLSEGDRVQIGKYWSTKKSVPRPRNTDLVYEQYDGSLFWLGYYDFDADMDGLCERATELVEAYLQKLADESVLKEIRTAEGLDKTQREQVILARRGQGLYRSSVMDFETRCRLTGVSDPRLLIASHMKPWCRCKTNEERLDGCNGLLLTPTVDRLFDRGFLTFEDDGAPRWSQRIPAEEIALLKLKQVDAEKKPFTSYQRKYLAYHRENVFR